MLQKIKSTYRELAKYLPELKNSLSPSARNKQLLLKMARKGMPRPTSKTKLGRALVSYTCKFSTTYDAKFNSKIRNIAPDWFVSRSQLIKQNKISLLALAREGKARPKASTPIGRALTQYNCKSSAVYCPKFDRQIRKIAPDWFASQKNRLLLLEMAKKGKPKPHRNTPLGRALVSYMKCRHRTDLELIRNIKKVAPLWLIPSSKQKKRILLEMAKRGEPRPHRNKHPLGAALVSYTTKKSGSYDPIFTKQIKKLAPHWFKKCSTR
jgi:hypothetical protein